jgi:hypothetical protein
MEHSTEKERASPYSSVVKPSSGVLILCSENLYLSKEMIEQTEMVVTEWHYHPPLNSGETGKKISSSVILDVMKKRASNKKGIACRFSCRFVFEKETLLEYAAEDSYVIDLADRIDKNELRNMIRNSYAKYKEKFDLRKLGTVLQNSSLSPLDEPGIDLDAILPLLET